jgi:hypothetical protein
VRKLDSAWELLFENFSIMERVEENGYFDIQASDFKKYNFEPRLLTKIDHSHQMPLVMNESKVSILTLSNSTWRIGPFDIFCNLPTWQPPAQEVIQKTLPTWLESLASDAITGEGALINAADASGIFSDFVDEELISTVNGKGRSGSFDFTIKDHSQKAMKIPVTGAQIEVDAGFEGHNALYLVEAKKHMSIDFNVRQLYYPFRTWNQRVQKSVRPIFITLANDVFDLTEFYFEDPEDFSSIRQVSHRRYMLMTQEIDVKEILGLANRKHNTIFNPKAEKVPFPQADDVERLIDLLDFVSMEQRSAENIAENYEFHMRQADYYFSAARYLNLGEIIQGSDGKKYRQLTPEGLQIAMLGYAEKRIALADKMLDIPAIREAYLMSIASDERLSLADVEKIVGLSSIREGISGSTLKRRSQTVLAWTKWLKDL